MEFTSVFCAHTLCQWTVNRARADSQSFVCAELWCPAPSCLWSPWCGAFRGECIDVDRGPMWLHTHTHTDETDRERPPLILGKNTEAKSATNGIHLQTVANTRRTIWWVIFSHHCRIMCICVLFMFLTRCNRLSVQLWTSQLKEKKNLQQNQRTRASL